VNLIKIWHAVMGPQLSSTFCLMSLQVNAASAMMLAAALTLVPTIEPAFLRPVAHAEIEQAEVREAKSDCFFRATDCGFAERRSLIVLAQQHFSALQPPSSPDQPER
jgi:hypothetical protein